jgi:hypothetical protein
MYFIWDENYLSNYAYRPPFWKHILENYLSCHLRPLMSLAGEKQNNTLSLL